MAGRDGKFNDEPEAEPGGFLGRWSRRKADAKTADAASPTVSADLQDADAGSDLISEDADQAAKETGEPPAFDVASLPDIDSLGPGSDFSMFMQTGVPQELKTRALRKLWRVKPELANLDGLLDYGEDLTGSFKVVDHLKTAYEVGRGFLRDQDDELGDQDDETEKTAEPTDDALETVDSEAADLETSIEQRPDTAPADEAHPEIDKAEPASKS